jgi:hypothetical protein
MPEDWRQEVTRSLYTCNHCKKDFSNEPNCNSNSLIQKVIFAGHAGMLCSPCHQALLEEADDLAKRFLG